MIFRQIIAKIWGKELSPAEKKVRFPEITITPLAFTIAIVVGMSINLILLRSTLFARPSIKPDLIISPWTAIGGYRRVMVGVFIITGGLVMPPIMEVVFMRISTIAESMINIMFTRIFTIAESVVNTMFTRISTIAELIVNTMSRRIFAIYQRRTMAFCEAILLNYIRFLNPQEKREFLEQIELSEAQGIVNVCKLMIEKSLKVEAEPTQENTPAFFRSILGELRELRVQFREQSEEQQRNFTLLGEPLEPEDFWRRANELAGALCYRTPVVTREIAQAFSESLQNLR